MVIWLTIQIKEIWFLWQSVPPKQTWIRVQVLTPKTPKSLTRRPCYTNCYPSFWKNEMFLTYWCSNPNKTGSSVRHRSRPPSKRTRNDESSVVWWESHLLLGYWVWLLIQWHLSCWPRNGKKYRKMYNCFSLSINCIARLQISQYLNCHYCENTFYSLNGRIRSVL